MRQFKNLFSLTVFGVVSLGISACGGGGSGSLPAVLATPAIDAATQRVAMRMLSAPNMVASGSVVGLNSGFFTLQTGYPHGMIHVYTNAQTVFVGPKPALGDSVSVVGTGSWSTYITATTVTQNNTIHAAGTVAGMGQNLFVLQTGYPHGMIRVQTDSTTKYQGGQPKVGDGVSVAGSGSWSTFIAAHNVAQGVDPSPSPSVSPSASPSSSPTVPPTPTPVPTATPTPGPTSNPSFPPNGSSNTTIMRSSPGSYGLFQVFDQFNGNLITSAQAQADGSRYGVIWGARPGMAPAWLANAPSLVASYYMPQETDASPVGWGDAGHNLSWWQANHPDWVLYACDPSGHPTTTPAYIAQITNNVPLDIHNPQVVQYQLETAGTYAIANHYNGIAFDEVLFTNPTGNALGSGYYGCGIYSNGSFVRRYSSQNDPAWTNDTVAWVKAAHALLSTDPLIAPGHLKMVVNHPAGNVSDPNEQAVLHNTDADLDETGFSDYGNYHASFSLFKTTTDWMRYAQAAGAAPLIVNVFSQSSPLTPTQIEYSIATYMMGHEGGAGVFAGNSYAYGAEQYLPAYQTTLGTPCGGYYGDSQSPAIFYRSFPNALVVVSNGSSSPQYAHLPTNHSYVDIMGRPVTNPLPVASNDAYVLLTSNGCH